MRDAARVLFWAVLALVAVATLGPIGLRPETGLPPQVERLAAFMVVGLLVRLAYPRRVLPALLGLVLLAGGLEAAQNAVAGRHGRWVDFDAKALGLVVGAALGLALDRTRGDDRAA